MKLSEIFKQMCIAIMKEESKLNHDYTFHGNVVKAAIEVLIQHLNNVDIDIDLRKTGYQIACELYQKNKLK